MYKKPQIIDCLYGNVGWRQTESPDFPTLTPSLLVSTSGRYFQDEHPLINIENLDQAFKNYSSFIYPAFAPLTVYLSGVRIDYNGQTYESIDTPNVGNQPDISPDYWTPVNPLSKKLEWLTKSSIDEVVSKLFIQKKLHTVTKSIFENVQIFDGSGNIQDKITKMNRFVGIAIELYDHRNLSLVLQSVGLQLTEENPDFDLYLFHSSSEAPIKKFDLEYINSKRFQWFDLDKTELKFFDNTLDSGGVWFLGYYESDLIGQAINKNYDFQSGPSCMTCNNDYSYHENWSRFAKYTPISVHESDLVGKLPTDPNGALLFDMNAISRSYSNNWGLNIDLSAKCDVSDLICKQADLFADAIRKEVGLRVLKELAYNTRNNVISKEVADSALYELNIKENPSGFMSDYLRTSKALDFDLSDMNDACLPCNNRMGISSGKV